MDDNRPKSSRDGISRMAINALTIQLNKDRMRAEIKSGLANISNDNKELGERITAALRLAGYIDENVATMPANMIDAFFQTMNNLGDGLIKQGVADLFKERIKNLNNSYPDSFTANYFKFVRNACDAETQERIITTMERMMKKYRQRTFGNDTYDVLKDWAENESNKTIEMALDALVTAQKINKREKQSIGRATGGVSLVGV